MRVTGKTSDKVKKKKSVYKGARFQLRYILMTLRVLRKVVFGYILKLILLPVMLHRRPVLVRLQSLSPRLLCRFHHGHQITLERGRKQ